MSENKEEVVQVEASETLKKVVRLFTYLEKVLALDYSIVRDFRNTVASPSPWWLADFPYDAENLHIRSLKTEQTGEVDSDINTAWLRVEKKNIKSAPVLPEELTGWISDISPLEKPIASEKIDRKTRFDQSSDRVKEFRKFKKDFQQGDMLPEVLLDWVTLSPDKLPELIEERYIEDLWENHPELQSLLEGYIENDWVAWAEKVQKTYKANLLYDQLYALRLMLKNEGDSYELLLGQGILTWKHRGVGDIFTPLFLTPLTLDFDASKGIIEISPDPMFRGFVEISALCEMDNPAEMDLIEWADKINAEPFDFWHFESLKSQSRTLLNYISTDGEDCFDKEITSTPEVSQNPCVWNAPILFVRKRTTDLWSKYAGFIRRDLEQNDVEATEFIRDLVGEYNETDREKELLEEKKQDISIKESDLFFPLPWNDEQKRIAERLDLNYGVVVKGPPGTGKSHTIANLISRFLAQGKTVLVTSQTGKALEVLRDKLPKNIRSLAVSQLQQSTRGDSVLQESIGEISSNLGERQTKFSEKKAENIRRELQEVREEKAGLANEIRKYILNDSSIKIQIDGEDVKPIEAAKLVSEYRKNEDIAWFTDEIPFEKNLDFTEDDLKELYRLLSELSVEERALHGFDLPDIANLPSEEIVSGAFASYRNLSAKSEVAGHLFDKSQQEFKQDELSALLEKLEDAKKILVSINDGYEKEIFDLCSTSQSEREKWQSVLSKIDEKMQVLRENNRLLLGRKVSGGSKFSVPDLLDGTIVLKEKMADGSRIGTFGKLLLPANAKYILENYTVDDRSLENIEAVEIVYKHILTRQTKKEINTLLEQSFAQLKSLSDLKGEQFENEQVDTVQLEVFAGGLKRIVGYHENFIPIDKFCKDNKALSSIFFTKLEDVERLIEIISSLLTTFEIINLENLFAGWIKTLQGSSDGKKHPIFNKFLIVIQKKNVTGWKNAFEELSSLIDKKEKAIRMRDIGRVVKSSAPNLCRDIIGLADQKEKFDCPTNIEIAWKIGRLESWLNSIHDHVSLDELQNQLERLTKKEYQLNSEIVTVLAWQRQIDKVTKVQRDALMAWSHEMKKYGKGTGKYAVTHLRAAQEALKEAKNAVPVWIMPLHRVAQMFPEPKAGMFDVVIFDEASQCDIRALNIGYLGKKLLVVGDPEQISPAGIFQDQEKIFELISRFLFDVPFKESFSITSSLFDLAKIRLSSIIQLNEHFRCVPEIIAFSNHHIYEGKLRPLRYPHPKNLLKPSLVPVLIESGYQNKNNKVNEPEAKAIVEKLVECLNDPRYQMRPDPDNKGEHLCTFGVVSLLAEDQAKYIKDLILQHPQIGENVIEERKIICGDAYAFQGDERDVMFLSMVKALDPDNQNDTVRAIADKGTSQRFNVAITRARDQVFLYHSIPLAEFRNSEDWRYKLLNWFYNPVLEELRAGREALKREFESGRASQFSFDVGNILVDRGYQVMPEYPVIGYRIDLVVQGENARLAVECDGDQYHTLENWEEDQVRERQLRRAGWEFWRVTGSAFYRHKEKALDSLWEKLEELGIKKVTD
jgi:very-short-patch-repair endonuclease